MNTLKINIKKDKKLPWKISFFLLVITIFSIYPTNSFYGDLEISRQNDFNAGKIDLTVRSDQSNFTSVTADVNAMKPGDLAGRDIYIGKSSDSLALQHRVSYEFVSGNAAFCDQLELRIYYNHYNCDPSGGDVCKDMREKYNESVGSLADLSNLSDSDFVIPHPDDFFDTNPFNGTEQWFYYRLKMPDAIDASYQNQTCAFNFHYFAWQTESDGSWGYKDEEILTGNTVSSGDWMAPVSSAGVLNAYYNIEPITIPFSATDDHSISNVTEVELWYRYESGTWTLADEMTSADGDFTAATSVSGNFNFYFLDGEGQYEFYTVATDDKGNREVKNTADTDTIYDKTPPLSTISYLDAIQNYVLVDDLTVSSQGAITTSSVLENGKYYLLQASGTYFAGGNTPTDIEADPEYSQDDYQAINGDVWTDEVRNYESYGEGLLELRINSSFVEWGEFHHDHVYNLAILGTGVALNFDVYDVAASNNIGNLNVKILEILYVDNGTQFSLTAVDDNGGITVSGVDSSFYDIDGGADQNYSATFDLTTAVLADGLHFIEYYSRDRAGNIEGRRRLYFVVGNQKKVVINEVYYNVDPLHGIELDNEWVELYNPNYFPVDLSNWTITDNTLSDTLPVGTTIPAEGFLLITDDASTWTYWLIGTTATLNLGNNIGSGLANGGDRIILRDDNSIEVDELSYGTDTTVFNPSITNVAEGHSIERSPVGIDTNTAADFIDRVTPTPGI